MIHQLLFRFEHFLCFTNEWHIQTLCSIVKNKYREIHNLPHSKQYESLQYNQNIKFKILMHPHIKAHAIKLFIIKHLKIEEVDNKEHIANTDIGKIELNNRPRVWWVAKKSSGCCWGSGEFTLFAQNTQVLTYRCKLSKTIIKLLNHMSDFLLRTFRN